MRAMRYDRSRSPSTRRPPTPSRRSASASNGTSQAKAAQAPPAVGNYLRLVPRQHRGGEEPPTRIATFRHLREDVTGIANGVQDDGHASAGVESSPRFPSSLLDVPRVRLELDEVTVVRESPDLLTANQLQGRSAQANVGR